MKKIIIAFFIFLSLLTNSYALNYEYMGVAELRAEANNGNIAAQYYLGLCYLDGKNGASHNPTEALRWFEAAASKGFVLAQLQTAVCYLKGNGCVKNLNKAAFWMEKAAEGGNLDAQLLIGTMYRFGQGVEINVAKAIYWFEKFERRGELTADILAYIGSEYYKGKDIQANHEKAVYYFKKGSDMGDPCCFCMLGKCYMYGEGVEKDLYKARPLLKKAIDKEYQPARETYRILMKDLILRAMEDYKMAYRNMSKAQSLIREGRALSSAKSSSNGFSNNGGYGLGASTNNSSANAKGERMVQEGEEMLENIDKLKNLVRDLSLEILDNCVHTTLHSKLGQKVECVIIDFDGQDLTMINVKSKRVVRFDAGEHLAPASIKILKGMSEK